jgi:ABC-type lipoprotein export system ATPase subunit
VSVPAVELRDVFCVHRTSEGDAAALQGLDLDVDRGELLCVLGPSGAGKSTLLRVIAGLQTPSAGIVRVLGHDIGRLPARLRAKLRHQSTGFLDQHAESALSPDLPVAHAVALPLVLRGADPAVRRARVAELLEAASLRERSGALPEELSGGERQRVAVCAALAHRPALLLADEPTGELDDAAAGAVRELIAELARTGRTTVIVVSHDPLTADRAGRTVRIRDGRIAEDRRNGRGAVVVGRGGWLHVPPELLAEVGIGERAVVRRVTGGLVVTPAGSALARAERADPPPAPDPSPVAWQPARLELRSLSRSRGRRPGVRTVIDGLTLSFAPGRLTAITGRSGAGKTTLLRLLAGLDLPESGELLLDGQPLSGRDREQLAALRRQRIGYLPQEPAPVAFLSATENVALALRLRGWHDNDATERATVALTRVGLGDRVRQRVARLSAGEQQRVALARALASARGLLIVDEPTSRLDQARAAAVGELLAAAAIGDRQTVICATHDPAVIRHAHDVVTLGR